MHVDGTWSSLMEGADEPLLVHQWYQWQLAWKSIVEVYVVRYICLFSLTAQAGLMELVGWVME